MLVTIKDPIVAVGIRQISPGDFFRFANGKDTQTAFVALSRGQEGQYNTVLICRDLNKNELRKLYVNTRKERQVIFLIPEEMTFRDSMPPLEAQIPVDDDEVPAGQEEARAAEARPTEARPVPA